MGGSAYINIGKLGTSRDYRKIGAYPRRPPGREVKFSHKRKMFFKNLTCGFDVSGPLMALRGVKEGFEDMRAHF